MNIKLATAILWSGSFMCYVLGMVFSKEITGWNIACTICALICAVLYFLDYRKSKKDKTL